MRFAEWLQFTPPAALAAAADQWLHSHQEDERLGDRDRRLLAEIVKVNGHLDEALRHDLLGGSFGAIADELRAFGRAGGAEGDLADSKSPDRFSDEEKSSPASGAPAAPMSTRKQQARSARSSADVIAFAIGTMAPDDRVDPNSISKEDRAKIEQFIKRSQDSFMDESMLVKHVHGKLRACARTAKAKSLGSARAATPASTPITVKMPGSKLKTPPPPRPAQAADADAVSVSDERDSDVDDADGSVYEDDNGEADAVLDRAHDLRGADGDDGHGFDVGVGDDDDQPYDDDRNSSAGGSVGGTFASAWPMPGTPTIAPVPKKAPLSGVRLLFRTDTCMRDVEAQLHVVARTFDFQDSTHLSLFHGAAVDQTMQMAVGAGMKLNDATDARYVSSHARMLGYTVFGQQSVLGAFPKPETLFGSLSVAKRAELAGVLDRLRMAMRLLVTLHHSISFLVSLARDVGVTTPLHDIDAFNDELASLGDAFANHPLTAAYGGYAQAILAQAALLEVTLSDVQALIKERFAIVFGKEVVAEALRTEAAPAKPADFENTNLARAMMRTTGKTVLEFVSTPPPAKPTEKPPKPTTATRSASRGAWRGKATQQARASAAPAVASATTLPSVAPAPAPPAAPPAAPAVAQRAARRDAKSGSQ
jgi:hypothetical protein